MQFILISYFWKNKGLLSVIKILLDINKYLIISNIY